MLVVGSWLADAFNLPRWLGTVLALSLAAVPVAVLVSVVLAGFDWARALDTPHFAELYLEVLLIGALVNGLFHLLGRSGAAEVAPPGAPGASPQAGPVTVAEPAFLRRLPPGFGPLLALSGEDHYVRVIAASRETLVLVRLRDAIAELDGVDGIQVHRSWWVARDAVTGSRRDGRALVLVLSNGREVPVARDKAALLRQSGWL